MIGVTGRTRFETYAWIIPGKTVTEIEVAVCGKLMIQSDSILVKFIRLQLGIAVPPKLTLIVNTSTFVKRNFTSYYPPPIDTAVYDVVVDEESVKSSVKTSLVEEVIRFPWSSLASMITSKFSPV